LLERRKGRWVYYSLDLEALGRLRSAVTGLLTPTDEAATSCVCSDCGPERGSRLGAEMLAGFGGPANLS
jgi:hypothetical protein